MSDCLAGGGEHDRVCGALLLCAVAWSCLVAVVSAAAVSAIVLGIPAAGTATVYERMKDGSEVMVADLGYSDSDDSL